jgi:predicted transcriptional regulator
MNGVSVLREQVKQFVDEASEKELEMVYHLLEASNTTTDWWDEVTPSHKEAIDKGIQQLDNGEGIPHQEVMKKYNKWLKK